MPARLVAGIIVGGACYLGLCLLSRDPTFKDGTEILFGALRKRQA
jgi:hypothetical protein